MIAYKIRTLQVFLVIFGLCGFSIVVSAATTPGGFDIGGSIDNTSNLIIPVGALSTNQPDKNGQLDLNHLNMDQTDMLRLWFTEYFSENVSLLVKANFEYSAHYSFISATPDATPLEPFSWDLEYLVFNAGIVDSFGPGTKFNIWAGRTDFRDFSGVVLNSKLDGVLIETGSPSFGVHLGVGTSALTFKNSSAIAISTADIIERTKVSTYGDPSSLLAPPRLIGNLEFEFKRLFLNQDLTIGAIGQLDMRPWFDGSDTRFSTTPIDGTLYDQNKPDKGAPVSMLYSGLNLRGKIAGPLYYNAWGYFGYGKTLTPVGKYVAAVGGASPLPAVLQTYKNMDILNGIGNIDFTILLPEALFSIIDLNTTIGTGDSDAKEGSVGSNSTDPTDINSTTPYNGFFGVTRTGGQLIFNPQPVNMWITQLTYSFKPFSGSNDTAASAFQLVVIGTLFVRPSIAQIGEIGLIDKSTDNYLGTEADLILNMRPSSDLGAGIGLGVFIPNDGALSRKVETKIQFSLSMSL